MQPLPPLKARPQGALRHDDGSVVWRIWAPRQESIRLVTWPEGKRTETEMQREAGGYFSYTAAEVPDGLRYAFRLGEYSQEIPDPTSRHQPDGVHRPSAVLTPSRFSWTDSHWAGITQDRLAIYELHVGAFTPEGTFAAIIPRLPELVDLGITAIELMPVAQFPGDRNWGYDGVHPYAVQNTYGGPAGLMQLVDAAHAAGIAVLLDVVYNHLGPEGNYLGMFGPYFTPRYSTPWGEALNYDGPDSDPVRRFVIDNACQWIRDFHIDGLRLDAVQTIYDHSALHLLTEIQVEVQETARQVDRSVVVIAETNQNDVRLVNPREQGGYGLSGVWCDDFHHSVHALLTGEREGYYVEFGEPQQLVKALNDVHVFDGCYSPFHRRRHGSVIGDTPRERFVVSIQNHDQIGNRAFGERLNSLLSPEARRLATALLLLAPQTPLLFMGEEYGERHPFPFFCSFLDPNLVEAVRTGRRREFAELAFRWGEEIPDPHLTDTFESARLTWNWPADSPAAGLRRLYQVLLRARQAAPPLIDRQSTRARLGQPGEPGLLLERGAAEAPLIAWANLAEDTLDISLSPPGKPAILSTSERRFGGSRQFPGELTELSPYELVIFGEPGWFEEA
ncbi:MAG: malto-oligosyltrehalose trehalohydrolase [Pirellulaceae bacterium]|nr:malto-oligosyltrehalose trehalohydrolase [Pirellulaceae bacterium]